MAATRYLVEGDRLDVLIGQVKRMGRRVTVLKAEKVRKGGIAGMFSKEHYEVLVEVDGVGEPPESFSNATKSAAKHQTLSEKAEESGAYRKKTVARGKGKAESGADQGAVSAGTDVTDSGRAEDKKDAGLQNLLDEARSQLNSGTEAAAADLEAQLAAMGINSATPPASPPSSTPSAPVPTGVPAGSSRPSATGMAGGTPRQGAPLLDARLQGVAAPGATSSAPRPVITQAPAGQRLPIAAALELGFPEDILAGVPTLGDDFSLDEFVESLPQPVELLEKPGSTIVVIGAAPIALSVVETAQRLAGRLGDDGYCVLGGPKTTLPGEALRARSAEELRTLMEAHQGQTCVLTLADSLIEVHRRTMAKLLSVIYVDQTWAVVDGRVPPEKLRNWLKGLPDALHPDTLAVQRIWEAERPGALFELGVPIGMLDGVPARGEAWKMLLEDLLAK